MSHSTRRHRQRSARRTAACVSAALTVVLALTACAPSSLDSQVSSSSSSGSSDSVSSGQGSNVNSLSTTITAKHPWDNSSFTQGLEVADDGSLLVGTGMYGDSRIYRTTLDNQQSQSQSLPSNEFGEGIALHGDTVWQLTWKEHVAIKRNASDLQETGQATYETEGWGLCSDGSRLIMSDGSDTLTFRDPETFAEMGSVKVTRDGHPVEELNELDCAEDGSVWANVWQTNDILRIDPTDGQVTDAANVDGLFPAADVRGADVLNGIAHIPGSDPAERKFYVTGKYWNELYEVQFQDQ